MDVFRKAISFINHRGGFDFLSDELYLKLIYWQKMGKKLNLKNPKRFNEKLQWLKLHDRKPEYSVMVDKYEVKNFVTSKIGSAYVIPTLGVWDKFEDIDFGELPDKFVLKCTHDSGGLVICKDKNKLDMKAAKTKINKSLQNNYYGRIKGVERPPLAPLIPTEKGVSLLIDCGANVDARPSHLVQFAKMGSIYMEHVVGIKNPRVAIVNIGAEEEKGNALVKETFLLLKECKDINFIGSIEAREIPHGGADVIVSEAFVGNVILKLYEGVGATLISMVKQGMMTSLRSKIGALLVKPALKTTLKAFDASQYGGAPLLGLKGLVVKTHGNSKRIEVCNSILQCVTFKEQAINEKIKESL